MSCQAVFHSFLSDDRKQDAATKSEISKRIIEMLQNRTVFFLTQVIYGKILMAVRSNITVQQRYIYH